jgi:hypothetical protein
MEDVLTKIAVSSASFVGKAAWSYAASLALKKVSSFVNERTKTESTTENSAADSLVLEEMQLLDQKLSVKLSIVNPIIDSCELSVAQGNTDLEPVLKLTDKFKTSLTDFGTNIAKRPAKQNIQMMKAVIEELDDLIPLLQLVLQTKTPTDSGKKLYVSPSRLMQASSHLVTTDCIIKSLSVENDKVPKIPVGPTFQVRLYTLFEGSARKASVDWTWKEEFGRANAKIFRSNLNRSYTLVLEENFDDGRYHDESQKPEEREIVILDILKLFYSCSGTLLNIQESLMPVLVLKVATEEYSNVGQTPKSRKPEWLALELYKVSGEGDDQDSFDADSESEGSEADLEDYSKELDESTLKLKTLDISSKTPQKKSVNSPAKDNVSLSDLCLLEYLLRLCSLEMGRNISHTSISDDVLSQYFVNHSSSEEYIDPVRRVSKDTKSSVPASPLAGRSAPRLMEKFLKG